jgi:hypothetical protein
VLAAQAAAVGGAIYSNTEPDAGSPIYGMADGTEEDIYGIANHKDDPGPTPTQGDGPIYGMASNSSSAQPISGMASSTLVDAGSTDFEEGAVYDNTVGVGGGHEEGVMYDNRASLYDLLDGPTDFDDVAVNPQRYEEFNMASQAIYDNNADVGALRDKGGPQTQWQQAGPAIYDTAQAEANDPTQVETYDPATADVYEDDDGLPIRGRSVRRLDPASVLRLEPTVTTAATPDAVDELCNMSRRDDDTLFQPTRSGSYFKSVLSVDNEGFAHGLPEDMEADMMEMERDGVCEPQFEIDGFETDDGYLGIES